MESRTETRINNNFIFRVIFDDLVIIEKLHFLDELPVCS